MLLSIDKSMEQNILSYFIFHFNQINLIIKCAVATVKDKNDQSTFFSAGPSMIMVKN
jgi:hypothetical protein